MIEYQTDQLAYPKILWNRPISRATAGRLLIIGGHSNNVATLQSVYQIASACGIGALTILAPDELRPLLGTIPEIDFGPATQSGSLAKAALAPASELASHADATLIGPDLSNNSETAIMIEGFISKLTQPLLLADDGLELVAQAPDQLRSRPNTLVILTMQQLFRLAGKLELPVQIKPDAGIPGKVDILADFWKVLRVDLALIGPEIIIKVGDQVSVTRLTHQPASLMPTAIGTLAVFYTQNTKAHYEALTTGAYLVKQAVESAANPTIAEAAANLTKAIARAEEQ